MNFKPIRIRTSYYYGYSRGTDHCAKKGCGENATVRCNIMLGKVPTWIYSCNVHKEQWP